MSMNCRDKRAITIPSIGFLLICGCCQKPKPMPVAVPDCRIAEEMAKLTYAQYRLPVKVRRHGTVLTFQGIPEVTWEVQIAHEPHALSTFKKQGCTELVLYRDPNGDDMIEEYAQLRRLGQKPPPVNGAAEPPDVPELGNPLAPVLVDDIDLNNYPAQ